MSLLPMKSGTHILISRFNGTYGFFARYISLYFERYEIRALFRLYCFSRKIGNFSVRGFEIELSEGKKSHI